MLEQQVKVTFFLDRSRPNKENKCLIKLNIYHKPIKKRYPTIFHVTAEEWERLNSSNLRDANLKSVKQKLNELQVKVEELTKSIVPFSFVAFEEQYLNKKEKQTNKQLQSWFDHYITELKAAGQIGTASSYTNTINSLNSFKANMSIHDITPNLLLQYEAFMLNNGKSISTIGIYLRQLRAILNQAIKQGIFSPNNYPFRHYQIPSGRNIKKALPESDLEKLLTYQTNDESKQKALDYWVFSYLCNGMNFADIIELKHENVSENYLFFIRSKTKRTKKKDLRPIKVGLNPMAIEIIKKYKNSEDESPYLFPILEAGLSPVTVKNRCKSFIKFVNKNMDRIRTEIGIEQKVGTYVARHSFSTLLKRKGVSTEFIKESLGHSSTATTDQYLDSFADEVKLQYSNLLTDFSKKQHGF